MTFKKGDKGHLGYKQSEATKQKIREKRKFQKPTYGMLGKHQSEKQKQIVREIALNNLAVRKNQFPKGHISWSKTHPHSEEALEKMKPTQFKKGQPSSRKGVKLSEEYNFRRAEEIRQKIRNARAKQTKTRLGVPQSEATKRIMRLNSLGNTYRRGKKATEATKQKIREARMNQINFGQKENQMELKVQNQLTKAGITFEIHKKIIGQPDIFIPTTDKYSKGICIFIDGCATHACPIHLQRIKKNFDDEKKRAYDLKITNQLFSMGYYVIRIWEHRIRKSTVPIKELLQSIPKQVNQ
jgi:G:T-mismatch repair DNA endonuclease (very short patch repair protein)